jgi:hypothetical protein
MPFWLDPNHPKYVGGHNIIRRGEREPVVVLDIDRRGSGLQQSFNVAGTQFAWGNSDGSVNIADLPEIQRRLAGIGLGW